MFRLQPSSEALIEKLVRARFKSFSQVNAQKVAEFSGGNARIAIALAGAIDKNETIANLTDEELFRRLFEQRHGSNPALLLIAQACSLVYSFQGEALTGPSAELPVFAALTGRSGNEVHQGVAELLGRDLVQQRGVWRAVLPHAIANRLAKMGLCSFPAEMTDQQLASDASERLRKSFSRRLGYLHDDARAVQIAEQWLAKGGSLGDAGALSHLGMAMFENIAPVAPEAVLAAIERADPKDLAHRDRFIHVLRSIAYDADLFERSARLLMRLEAQERDDSSRREPFHNFAALFFIILSGTRASVEQRLALLDALLRSDKPEERAAGVHALRNMLEVIHFSSGFSFDFGARPRDYGYWPKNGGEVTHWFISVLKLTERVALSDLPVSAEARRSLAGQLRGLWTLISVHGELERVCRTIAKGAFWREGWIAICQTLHYDGKGMAAAAKAKLQKLEGALRPSGLVQKVRAIVLSTGSHGLDLDDFDDEEEAVGTLDRPDRIAVALGRDVAHDPSALTTLAAELTSVQGAGRLWRFGQGMASAAPDPESIWTLLVDQFTATPERTRNAFLFRGFLQGLTERDATLANALLDSAVSHPALAAWFPELQASVMIDDQGVKRLHQSLRSGKAPVWQFNYLKFGRAADPIPGRELKKLLTELASKDGGFEVAVEILSQRLFSDRSQKRAINPELIAAGRQLLKQLAFSKRGKKDDHQIGELIKVCLSGPSADDDVKDICARLLAAIAARKTYGFEYDQLLQGLFKAQPKAALDGFFGSSNEDLNRACQLMRDISHHHTNPLDFVPVATLLAWCEAERGERYPLMAKVVSVFAGKAADAEAPALKWSDAATALLEKAPDKIEILKIFIQRFRPMSWSGSRAAVMEARLPLLTAMGKHREGVFATIARVEAERFKQEIELERKHETERDKEADERFE